MWWVIGVGVDIGMEEWWCGKCYAEEIIIAHLPCPVILRTGGLVRAEDWQEDRKANNAVLSYRKGPEGMVTLAQKHFMGSVRCVDSAKKDKKRTDH